MRLYEITIRNKNRNLQPFDTSLQVGNDIIDNFKKDPDYFRTWKSADVDVVMMPPYEYIKRVILGFTANRERIGDRSQRINDKSYQYSEDMLAGDKFPMPYLDLRNGGFGQEGWHRAEAAEMLGIDKIPVAIIKSTD